MVEKTDALLNKGDVKLLSGFKDSAIVLGSAWGCDVLDTGAGGSEDVVDEWELRPRMLACRVAS